MKCPECKVPLQEGMRITKIKELNFKCDKCGAIYKSPEKSLYILIVVAWLVGNYVIGLILFLVGGVPDNVETTIDVIFLLVMLGILWYKVSHPRKLA